jgi:hypothetical protein
MLRGPFLWTQRELRVAIARLAALSFHKGMVSDQNDRLSHSRMPVKILFN